MNERVYKTEAVVLRRSDFGESDLLVTLYTPRHGKIRALAKGARKPTSRLTGQVELYAQVNLLINRGRELHIISQAETQKIHAPFQEDLERSYYASHFVELLDQFAYEGEENRAAYDLLLAALGWIGEPDINLKLAARYYEFRLLRVMGYEPSVFQCAVGDEDLEAEDQFFSAIDGGVVCHGHGEGRDLMRVALPVFKVLRHFSRHRWGKVKELKLTDSGINDQLERILQTYLVFLLERRLQSANLLRQMKRDLL